MSDKPYPNAKVDALIKGQVSIDSSWSVDDFADLCIAAADQCGASLREQKKISDILGVDESDENYLERTGEPRGAGRIDCLDWSGGFAETH